MKIYQKENGKFIIDFEGAFIDHVSTTMFKKQKRY